jgi:hypothetical protein
MRSPLVIHALTLGYIHALALGHINALTPGQIHAFTPCYINVMTLGHIHILNLGHMHVMDWYFALLGMNKIPVKPERAIHSITITPNEEFQSEVFFSTANFLHCVCFEKIW